MNKWISVKDRLPDQRCEILIFIPAYPGISIGSYSNETFYDHVNRLDHDNKVTYWMELPNEPK